MVGTNSLELDLLMFLMLIMIAKDILFMNI